MASSGFRAGVQKCPCVQLEITTFLAGSHRFPGDYSDRPCTRREVFRAHIDSLPEQRVLRSTTVCRSTCAQLDRRAFASAAAARRCRVAGHCGRSPSTAKWAAAPQTPEGSCRVRSAPQADRMTAAQDAELTLSTHCCRRQTRHEGQQCGPLQSPDPRI